MTSKNGKYNVYYYGTHNYGLGIAASNITDFNKSKLGKIDGKSSADYSLGKKEIEKAINGHDIAPTTENFNLQFELEKFENKNSKMGAKESLKETKEKEKKKSNKTSVPPKKKINAKITKPCKKPIVMPVKQVKKKPIKVTEDEGETVPQNVPFQQKIDDRKRDFLETELKLTILMTEIQSSVTLSKFDTVSCIENLEQLKLLVPKMTTIILKKNPDVVKIVGSLKRFKGNFELANIDEDQFKIDVERIKNLANQIFRSFEEIFEYNQDSFCDYFSNEVSKFEKKIEKQDEFFIADLCYENEISE